MHKEGLVSETTPQISEQTPPLAAEPAPQATAKASGRGPAWLALLVGLAGLGVGAWSAWQLHQQQGQAAEQLERLREIGAATETRLQGSEDSVAKKLAGLPSADQLATQRDLLVSLQGEQQRLAQSLSGLLGKSREDWRLAEAEHLLRLAMLRLSALQDVDSAIALVQGADDILRAQNDPQAFAARGELIKVLEALRSLPQLDRSGLFLQLAALRGQAAQLQTLTPEYLVPAEAPAGANNASDASRWEELWQQVSRYVLRRSRRGDHFCTAEVAALCLELTGDSHAAQTLDAYLDVFSHHYLQAKHQLPPQWEGEAHHRLQALARGA